MPNHAPIPLLALYLKTSPRNIVSLAGRPHRHRRVRRPRQQGSRRRLRARPARPARAVSACRPASPSPPPTALADLPALRYSATRARATLQSGPCTPRRDPLHPAPIAARDSGPGAPAAPAGDRLRLLPSGPDLVRKPTPRGTRTIDAPSDGATGAEPLGGEFSPARADCGFRAPLPPRLARSAAILTHAPPHPVPIGCPAVTYFKSLLSTTALPRQPRQRAALLAAIVDRRLRLQRRSSTITVGNENSADNALIKDRHETTSSTTTATPQPRRPPAARCPKNRRSHRRRAPPPTKLETKDLIVGTGAEAKAGDTVTVNYVGVLYKSGKVFDASWKRNEPFTFTLGKGQVITGWDQGIAGMKVGGRRELIIPAALAYGAKGSPPTIPRERPAGVRGRPARRLGKASGRTAQPATAGADPTPDAGVGRFPGAAPSGRFARASRCCAGRRRRRGGRLRVTPPRHAAASSSSSARTSSRRSHALQRRRARRPARGRGRQGRMAAGPAWPARRSHSHAPASNDPARRRTRAPAAACPRCSKKHEAASLTGPGSTIAGTVPQLQRA